MKYVSMIHFFDRAGRPSRNEPDHIRTKLLKNTGAFSWLFTKTMTCKGYKARKLKAIVL